MLDLTGDLRDRVACRRDGTFELSVPAGSYELQADGEGWAPSRPLPLSLKAGERREGLAIELVPAAGIRGTVRRRDPGRFAAPVFVRFRPFHNHRMEWGTTTGEEGRFEWTGLPPGAFELEVQPATRRFDQAVVFDPRGYPVRRLGVVVRTLAGDLATEPYDTALQEGVIHLGPLEPGRYRVTLVHPGYASASVTLPLPSREPARRITLRPGGSLEVTVRDGDGEAVPGAELALLEPEGRNVLDDRAPVPGCACGPGRDIL